MSFLSACIMSVTPVRRDFVVSKCVVPLLNDGNAAIIGNGHRGSIRYGIVD